MKNVEPTRSLYRQKVGCHPFGLGWVGVYNNNLRLMNFAKLNTHLKGTHQFKER